MALKAAVFDLDGTLLDTLPDLTALTNAVMRRYGYPEHTSEEVLSYIGDGARMLLRRAIPQNVPDTALDDLMQTWRHLYPDIGYKQTQPYPGIPETLQALKAAGAKLGVLSNKFDAAVCDTITAFFPHTFDVVHGEGATIPRKPDPTGLQVMADELGISTDEIAFIGDTGETDMAAARAAGAFPVGVSWGYHDTDDLILHGARVVIDNPNDIVALCMMS